MVALVSQLQEKTYASGEATYQDTNESLELLAEIVGALGVGLVFVDQECRMGFANQRARRLLETDAHLIARGTRLAIRDRADDLKLERLVRGIMGGRASGGADNHFMRLQGSAGTVTILRMMPVPSPTDARDGKLIVLIHQMHEPITPSKETLQHIFGCTPAEAVIAQHLTQGKSLEEVASCCNISVGTVRVHLRSIFGKTNTNRQGELVSLLAGSAKIFFD